MIYNTLMSATNDVGGNVFAYVYQNGKPVKTSVCNRCDCENGHFCLLCDRDLSEESCIKRQGLCIDCAIERDNQ